jgi:ABC-type oligopeptide transport system substrate-binding subunit
VSERIDPHQQAIINQKLLLHALFATLFRFEQDSPPRPLLVKTVTRIGQKAQMELHENIFFSNGRPITSEDVIHSLERLLRMSQNQSSLRRYIEGAEAFIRQETEHCSGLTVIDPRRFEIHYRLQFSTLLHLLSQTAASILPRDWQPEADIYSGPYILEKRVLEKGRESLYLKNSSRWSLTRPQHEQVRFTYHQDPASFFDALKAGEPDYFLITFGNELPFSDIPYRIDTIPTNGQFYMLLNPRIKPFDDPAWRVFFRDIILVISKKMQDSWRGSINARLVMPYGLTGYDLFKPLKPGPIARPSQPEGEIILPIHLSRSPLRVKLHTILNKKLSPHQVRLAPVWEPVAQTMKRVQSGDFTMTGFYYLSETPININFFEDIFVPGQELNPAGFVLAEAQEQIRLFHLEENDLQRMRLLAKLEALAQESAFLIPLLGLSYTIGSREGAPLIVTNRYLNIYIDQLRAVHER